MAKEQKRGNREMKKPKKQKEPVAATATAGLTKGISASASIPKKKG